MGCTCAPALIQARNELNALFPDRDKASDGCCGDAAHAARKSDHNPSIEGYARAYDYDEDIVEGMGDSELSGMALILLADKRTKYLIYEAQLLYPDGTVKPYSGINAHRHHLHHSIHDWAVLDKRPWNIAQAFAPPPPPEDDDMARWTYAAKATRNPDGTYTAAGPVYLVALGEEPVHVTFFADVEYHARREGLVLLDPPKDAKAVVKDGRGVVRDVMALVDGTLHGI